MLSVGAGGFLALDYNMARQAAAEADEPVSLSMQAYLDGLSTRIASVATSASLPSLPGELADMLPLPPEGWTARPVEKDDVTPFFARNPDGEEPAAQAVLLEVVSKKLANVEQVTIQTYEKGDQRLIVQLARYPDEIFTDPAWSATRYQLQTAKLAYRAVPTMTVRGLDITEVLLPDGIRGRLFMADVGGQIHLRVLAPGRMREGELLPFLETLHVAAMNASVVDKTDGLGDVPVIVVASALGDDARTAYDADRAARTAARLASARTMLDEAQALAAAGIAAPTEGTTEPVAECETSAGGIKRCTVSN